MTQAACALILHYSTARLSWKTIKSLRRSRSRLHNNEHLPDDTVRIKHDASQVEFEILQGWTIIALHTLFVATGLEYAVRFIIPFYYHFKMLMLIAFTIPSWALMSGRKEEDENSKDSSYYGLSPLIPFCFNNILVPGVHKVHSLMDNDPKGWILYAIAVTPLLILDYVFLPGILLTDEQRKSVRAARLVEKKERTKPPMKSPPRRAFPPPITSNSTTIRSKVLSSVPELPAEISTPPRRENTEVPSSKGFSFTQTPISPFLNKMGKSNLSSLSGFSPLAKSRITSSAMRLRQFSRDHNVPSSIKPRSKSRQEQESLHNERDESISLPRIRRRNKASDDIFESSGPTPTKLSDEMDIDLSDVEDEDDKPFRSKPNPQRRKNRERQRLSFGDHFREIVTGDASIRVRDHLFDLETGPLPSPRRRRGGNSSEGGSSNNNKKEGMTLSPNVTTRRRSSRLAKRKGYQQLHN